MKGLVNAGRFLGVDESNHGGETEIIVGVYSDNPFDLQLGDYGKQRAKRRLIEHAIKDGCCFNYIAMPKSVPNNVGINLAKAITIAELVKASEGIEEVLMDGIINPFAKGCLEKFLKGFTYPILEVIVKGDRKYPLINMADNIANRLYRYDRFAGIPEEYCEFEISPDYEQYYRILDTIGL